MSVWFNTNRVVPRIEEIVWLYLPAHEPQVVAAIFRGWCHGTPHFSIIDTSTYASHSIWTHMSVNVPTLPDPDIPI